MGFSKILFLSILFISVVVLGPFVFAEETPAAGVSPVEISTPAPSPENDIQWAWGDVVNIDSAAKTLTIKYLDYETDQEKELVLTVNEKTTFENVKTLEEIKLKDTLSIDYAVTNDSKNIAKNISLEKPDELPASPEQKESLPQPKETAAATEVLPETLNQTIEQTPAVKTQEPAQAAGQISLPAAPSEEPQAAEQVAPPAQEVGKIIELSTPALTEPQAPEKPALQTQPETSGQAQ